MNGHGGISNCQLVCEFKDLDFGVRPETGSSKRPALIRTTA
jgi:hypothetical protein